MTEIDRTTATVARGQHGVFAAWQVPGLTKHVARHRTSTGRWTALAAGVYALDGAPATWEQELWRALLVAGTGSVVGRRSAARLHRLPGTMQDHIDIVQPESSVPMGKPPSSRRSSLLPAQHVTTIGGFPVTTVERTLFDLAGLTSLQRRRRGWAHMWPERVERMLDDAIVRDQVTIVSMSKVLADLACRGRPGTRLIRTLIEDRSDGYVATESELEDLFSTFVERHRLPRPRKQVALGARDDFVGRVDFLFSRAKVVVEVDGSRFHDQRSIARRDRRRDLKLRAAGWETLRIDWWQLVEEPEETASLLRAVLIPTDADGRDSSSHLFGGDGNPTKRAR